MARKNEPAVEERDPHEGMGGSYVVDPLSGKRELKERTKERNEAGVPEPHPAESTETAATTTTATEV